VNKKNIAQFLSKVKVVAVIRKIPESALDHVAGALITGGIRAIEITLDSQGATRGIARIRDKYPDKVVIGAGTVLNADQLKDAVDAGAEFLVSPHLDLHLIEQADAIGRPLIPGVLTPTEVYSALRTGTEVVKVFPGGTMGPSYIQNLLGPFGNLKIMVTGGITDQNASEFIQAGAVAVGIGSALFPRVDVETQNWKSIEDRARRLLTLVSGRA
jgi:2-dehydro-3-deoxyphosphogluconate aldolase/(4S)-4-hydroxy-2-oxoglutarate aldolase